MRWIREHKLISVLIVTLLILTVIFGISVVKGGEKVLDVIIDISNDNDCVIVVIGE